MTTARHRPAGRPRGRLAPRVRLAALGIAIPLGAYAIASCRVWDTLSAATGRCWPRDAANSPEAFIVPDGFDPSIAEANRMPAARDVAFHPRDPRTPGLVLRGWWIPGAGGGAPAVIVVHGVNSCRREANVLIPAAMLHRHGCSVLLLDLRNHGDSDHDNGRTAAATREYHDVLGAWDWLVGNGTQASRIGIMGVSLGAACAIVAGGEDQRVAAVWADSSWADVLSLLRHLLASDGRPPIVARGAIAAARLVVGDTLTSPSPLAAVPRYAGRPLAIVHGADGVRSAAHALFRRSAGRTVTAPGRAAALDSP